MFVSDNRIKTLFKGYIDECEIFDIGLDRKGHKLKRYKLKKEYFDSIKDKIIGGVFGNDGNEYLVLIEGGSILIIKNEFMR